MTVILAVEPDPRQASRLSSVLRGRRNTDVVIAKSANTAIESIAGRVPDVLLTSQLLSPQDETRLADWLKELGPAGAHVQALTIPILAPKVTKEEPQPRGLLAGLRRRPRKTGPHGCEQKLFAEHVAAYLDKGMVDRGDEVIPEVQAVAGVVPELAAPEPMLLEPALPEPAVADVAQPETVVTEAFVAEPAQPMRALTAAAYDDDEGLWLLTRSPQVIEFDDEPASPEPETQPLGLRSTLPLTPLMSLPREVVPVPSFEVVFEPPEVITVRDEGAEARAVRRTAAAAAPPAVSVDPEPETTPPVQDEWGFFDPNKCGFSALLNKLDEITDDDRHSTADVEASVRIVTHY